MTKRSCDILASVISDQLRLAGALNVLTGARFAISAGLAVSMMLSVNSSSVASFGLGDDQLIRITPDESISSAVFTIGAAEVASSLANRLIAAIGR